MVPVPVTVSTLPPLSVAGPETNVKVTGRPEVAVALNVIGDTP